MSRILPATETEAIADTARLLDEGGLVALPTETVYGLAADAANGEAVANLYAAKGRPSFNPLIAHVSSQAMAESIVTFDPVATRLAAAFWPGPLTLVLPARDEVSVHPLARAGLPTIAVRMPDGAARAVIARLGRPLVAPSANRSGGVSPTTAAHVVRSLGDRVALVLDGGAAPVGLESTIVRAMADRIVLLRPGAVSSGALGEATALPVVAADAHAGIEAPGQMRSHYAPHGTVRLEANHVSPGEWLVRFGTKPLPGEAAAAGVLQLSAAESLTEAAANLYRVLNELDRPDVRQIAVMPIPGEGLGAAINDRLARAAAPRDS